MCPSCPSAPCPQLIAQIDNPSAISSYDEILRVADGIMVSRGHLGMRMPARKVRVCLVHAHVL